MSGHHRWADVAANHAFLRATGIERHAGMHCICHLIDCCHSEMPEDGYSFRDHGGHHMDSGSPQSGYLYPWEPGDESWREQNEPPFARDLNSSPDLGSVRRNASGKPQVTGS